ncbi:MAG: M48 family metallopeptidase [Candidatus Limnocylindria bacterium]
MTEEGSVPFGGSRIAYSVVRSARRHKTVELTVARPGEVVVAAPLRSSSDELQAIVRRRAGWIVRHGGVAIDRPPDRRYVSGASLPYLGREVRVFLHEGDGPDVDVRFGHWQFDVGVPDGLAAAQRQGELESAFKAWYRARAAQRLRERVRRFAGPLGATPAAVLVCDQRRRWGSCSPDGVLRFNWRIVMAPPALIDYVVIHEIAHLRVRSHQKGYWALVARAAPDYRERRERLRALGPTLEL